MNIQPVKPFRIGQTCQLCKDRCTGACRDPEHDSPYGDNNPPVQVEYHQAKYGMVNEWNTIL